MILPGMFGTSCLRPQAARAALREAEQGANESSRLRTGRPQSTSGAASTSYRHSGRMKRPH